MQHVTSNNVGSSWPTMLHPFAWGFGSTNETWLCLLLSDKMSYRISLQRGHCMIVICQRSLPDSVWERLAKCPLFFQYINIACHLGLHNSLATRDTTNIVAKFHYWKYKWLPTLCGHVTWSRTKDQQFSWYTVFIRLNAILDQMLQMEAKLLINASLT